MELCLKVNIMNDNQKTLSMKWCCAFLIVLNEESIAINISLFAHQTLSHSLWMSHNFTNCDGLSNDFVVVEWRGYKSC